MIRYYCSGCSYLLQTKPSFQTRNWFEGLKGKACDSIKGLENYTNTFYRTHFGFTVVTSQFLKYLNIFLTSRLKILPNFWFDQKQQATTWTGLRMPPIYTVFGGFFNTCSFRKPFRNRVWETPAAFGKIKQTSIHFHRSEKETFNYF
jgi:hypothetical protein